MADQKIGVILDFKANTSQAKQSMAQLQQYLTQISSGANLNVNSASIQTASKAAKELAYHLSAAYNADTGKLDLGKLNASLNSAKANIGDLSSRLLQAGATGQQAFVQLAKSMSMAEAPAFRLNSVVGKLWTSLKNVATWQISSTVLMGFTSAISEAYQFSQDLNESLNEIRIVTGNNVEEMQRFAKEANKAAKALSTTTTKYTDASLIYFQQGLNEKQVKERTDLTIKMANVTGQSVSEVSDQLTSVWNNFDDGTKALEYYVDVMTALGAATASSSEEISEGLNKFAAVAETVGLSYEYAAAALATVTATTRQSADIVGTAFKTLFTRIQDLELGETLDDGTTMGQYSQALAAVGINIKDVNGEVKDMNIILDEMGAKWNTLTKDTQIALAQNVAGVRQYTQLIALMDNWSYFQENLNTAYTSTGELQKQADIYAEGWEAARDRVTASLEDIYQDVLKDDFFIDLLNGIADVTEGVDTFIEKLGGIEPIIIGLSSLLLNSISNKIQPAIYSIISSIRSITPTGAAKEAAKASQPMVDKINNQLATGNYNQSDKTALENSKQLLQVKNQLWTKQKDMTDAEKQMAQIDLDLIEKKQSELQTTADIIVKMQEKIAVQKEINIASKLESDFKKSNITQEELLRKKIEETKAAYDKQNNIVQNFPKLIKDQEAAISRLKAEQDKTNEGTKAHLKLQNRIVEEEKKLIELQQTLRQTENLGLRGQAYEAYQRANEQLNEFVNKNSVAETVISKTGQAMVEAYQKAGQAAAEAGEKTTQAFLGGKSTVSLNSVSESFFTDNKEIFDAVGTKKAYSTINAKNALSSFRGILGEDIMSQNDNHLGNLFDSAESATSGQQLKIIIGEIQKALQETTISAEQLENSLKNFGDVGEQAVNDVRKPLSDLDNNYKKLIKQQEELNKQIKDFQPKHIVTGTEVFAKLSSGATSAVMAFNGLLSISKQLKENGAPDSLEEWASILMSITFVAPQVINAFKNIYGMGNLIKTFFTSQTALMNGYNALLFKNVTLQDQQTGAITKTTLAEVYATAVKEVGNDTDEEAIRNKLMEIGVSKGLTTETEKEIFATGLLNAVKQKGTIWTKMQTAADSGNIIAKKLLSIAQAKGIVTINAETGAVIANTAAWYANPIMWIAAIIIAVAAAVALLVAGIIALTKALQNDNNELEKATNRLEKATTATENLADSTEKATEQVEKLRNAFDKYKEVQSILENTVQGSEAWNEALAKNQENIQAILDLYPELASLTGALEFTNGAYSFTDQALAYAEANSIMQESSVMLGNFMSQMYKAYSQDEYDKLKRKEDRKDLLNITRINPSTMNTTDSAVIGSKNIRDIFNLSAENEIGFRMDSWKEIESIDKVIIDAINNKLESAEDFDITSEEFRSEVMKEISDLTAADGDGNYESLDDWMKKQWDIDDFTNTTVNALFEAYSDNLIQIESLQQKEISAKQEYNNQLKTLSNNMAINLLQTIKGYSDLEKYQQQAVAEILGNQLTQQYLQAQNLIFNKETLSKEAQSLIIDWLGYGGNRTTGLENTNNASYSEFFNSELGIKAWETYIEEIRGYNPYEITKSPSVDEAEKTITYKVGEEDVTIPIQQFFAELAGEGIYQVEKYTDLMAEGATLSATKAGAIIGNYLYASVGEMQRIGITSEGEISNIKAFETHLESVFNAGTGLDLIFDKTTQSFTDINGELENEAEILAQANNALEAALAYSEENAKRLAEREDLEKGNALIGTAVETYDLDAEALKTYAQNLKAVNQAQKMSYESAAKIAIVNARYQKGIESLNDVLEDSLYYLKSWDDASYQTAEAAAGVIAALKDIFGIEVSASFVKTYIEDIEKLTQGGEEAIEAYEKLELLAAKDYVINLHLENEAETALTSALDELTKFENDISIGASIDLDSTEAFATLQKLVEEQKLSVDQIQAAFESIGWSPEFTEGEPIEQTSTTYTMTQERKANAGDDLTDDNWESGSWQKITTTSFTPTLALGKDSKVTYTPKTSSSISAPKVSGGGGKSNKKEKKTYADEIERYHEINEELDDLQKKYDAIGKAKDRAFGQKKLDLIEDEISATEDLINAQERLIDETKTYLEDDKAKLSEYGANFDPETGRLTNYDEMYKVNIDQYNRAVDSFNAGKMTDEQFEEYEKEYEEFTEDLAQYEETLNKLQDEEETLLDFRNQNLDKRLEAVTSSVELEVELADEAIKHLEFQIENLGDSWENLETKISHMGQVAERELAKIKAYQQGLRDTLAITLSDAEINTILDNPTKLEEVLGDRTLTADQIEQLRNYSDELMNSNKAMKEMRNTVQEELVTAFEDWNSEMDEGIDTMDHLSNMLQGYRDIIDLVGKDNLGISNDLLNKMNQTNVENSQNALKSTRRILEANKNALTDAKDKLSVAITEEDKKFWQDTIDTLTEKVESGEEELLSRWQESLQAAADAYSDAVDQVMETFEEAMSGVAGSFEALQTKYNQQKDINERYLADYEKIYNLSKLTREIEGSIDTTDSIKAKRELRDLQEEIYNLQESGAEMTQYEVDELRARYDLRLAEIALEEAQNAKSQVRMRRDSEGNWSYVYTADENKVGEAEQNVEDKLYAYQELTQNRIDEMTEQMIGLPEEFANAIQAIAKDLTLTDEERKKKMEETTQFYQEKYKYLGEQLNIATDDAKWLYENDWNNYAQATGYKISENQKWVDDFGETIIKQTTGWTTLDEAQSAFELATTTMLTDLDTAYSTYQINIDKTMKDAGTTMTDFAGVVEQETEDIKEDSDAAAKSVESIADSGEKGFEGLVNAASDWLNDYNTTIASYIKTNEGLAKTIADIIAAYAEIPEVAQSANDALKATEEQAKATAAEVAQVDKKEDKEESAPSVEPTTTPTRTSTYTQSANSRVVTHNGEEYGQLENGEYAKLSDLENTENWGPMGIIGSGSNYKKVSINLDKIKTYSQDDVEDYEVVGFTGGHNGNYASAYSNQTGTGAVNSVTEGSLVDGKILAQHNDMVKLKYIWYGKETTGWFNKSELQFYNDYLSPSYKKTSGGGAVARDFTYKGLTFDTGGYTGEWDSSGRLAMLHQKEIVLNAHDTENFLQAINIVRDIASMIDLRAAAQQSALSMMAATSVAPMTQTLQQEVTIHAEFPNATQRTEIEAAFDTLLNRASQFANRKN